MGVERVFKLRVSLPRCKKRNRSVPLSAIQLEIFEVLKGSRNPESYVAEGPFYIGVTPPCVSRKISIFFMTQTLRSAAHSHLIQRFLRRMDLR